jgi:hypothetical protein
LSLPDDTCAYWMTRGYRACLPFAATLPADGGSTLASEPTHPCPRCARVVGPMHLQVENLRHLGWGAYRVESYVNWCGHAQ